jgi:hypothetical protein
VGPDALTEAPPEATRHGPTLPLLVPPLVPPVESEASPELSSGPFGFASHWASA